MHSLRTWRRRSRLIREGTRQLRALHQLASRHAKPNARLTITSTSASRLFLKPSRSVRTSRPSTTAGQSPCRRRMGSSPATAATESGRDSTGLECMRRNGYRAVECLPHALIPRSKGLSRKELIQLGSHPPTVAPQARMFRSGAVSLAGSMMPAAADPGLHSPEACSGTWSRVRYHRYGALVLLGAALVPLWGTPAGAQIPWTPGWPGSDGASRIRGMREAPASRPPRDRPPNVSSATDVHALDAVRPSGAVLRMTQGRSPRGRSVSWWQRPLDRRSADRGASPRTPACRWR